MLQLTMTLAAIVSSLFGNASLNEEAFFGTALEPQANVLSADEQQQALYSVTVFNYNGYEQTPTVDDVAPLYYAGAGNDSYSCFSVIDINLNGLAMLAGLSYNQNFVYHIKLPGEYHQTSEPYYVYDARNSSRSKELYAADGELTIDYHYDYSNYENFSATGGWLSLCVFHVTDHPQYEFIHMSQIRAEFDTFVKYEGVSYGETGDANNVMDVYMPVGIEGVDSLPVVLTIHGGDWSGGNRFYYNYLEEREGLASYGYIHVNMDYRLASPNVGLEDILTDVDEALYAVQNDPRFSSKADLSRLCLWGHSAGGHIAMMYSFREEYGNLAMRYSPKLLIAEGAPYYLSDSNTYWLMPDINNDTYYNDIMNYLMRTNGVSYYNNPGLLDAITPCRSVERVPDMTVARYFTNDGLVDSTRIENTLFSNELFWQNGTGGYALVRDRYGDVDVAHNLYSELSLRREYSHYLWNTLWEDNHG